MSEESESAPNEGRGSEGGESVSPAAPIAIVVGVVAVLLGLILLFVVAKTIISLCAVLTEVVYEKKKKREETALYKQEKKMESAQTKFFYKKLDDGLTLRLTSINAYIDVNMEKYKKLSKINFQDFRTLLNHSSGLAYILKRRAKEAQRSYKMPPGELFITDRVGVAARIYHKAGSSVGTYYTNLAFGPTYYDAQGDLHIRPSGTF